MQDLHNGIGKSLSPRHTGRKTPVRTFKSAYVEARYNDDFVVTKEDIDALMPKVELLRDVVENVCRKQFDYYKQKIAQ